MRARSLLRWSMFSEKVNQVFSTGRKKKEGYWIRKDLKGGQSGFLAARGKSFRKRGWVRPRST